MTAYQVSAPLGRVDCARLSHRFRVSVELELGIQPNYIILVMEKNCGEIGIQPVIKSDEFYS